MIPLILILAFYSGIFFLIAHSLKRRIQMFAEMQALEMVLFVALLSTVVHTVVVAINLPRWVTTLILLLAALTETRRIDVFKYRFSIILTAITLFPLLFFVLANTPTYDTGLYHLTSIKWLSDVGFSPGIANVDGRLGTNQFFFLFAALFDIGPLYGTTWVLLQVLLLVFVLFDLARNLQKMRWKETVWTAVLLLVFIYNKGLLIGSSMDLWAFVYAFTAIKLIARGQIMDKYSTFAFMFASYAVCLKLSLLPIFLLALFIFSIRLLRITWHKEVPLALIVSGLLFAILGTHSFINTGYWIYPATFTAIPEMDWKVPEDQVKQMVLVISNFAKVRYTGVPLDYSEIMPPSAWFGSWLTWFLTEFWEVVIMWFVGIILTIRSRNTTSCSLLALSLMGTAYFVLMAPSPRFGLIWMFIPLGIYIQQLLENERIPIGIWKLACLIVWILLVVHLPSKMGYGIRNAPLLTFPNTPKVDAKKVGYDKDLSHNYFYTPIQGELIWNMPLPATTKWKKGNKFIFINTQPEWRGEEMKQGFRTKESLLID